MNEKKKLKVKGKEIIVLNEKDSDYISLTDIAKTRENSFPDQVIQNWMRNKHTVEFLGVFEKIHNNDFKPLDFEGIKEKAGSNSFVLTPTRWIEKTNAIGFLVKRGKYGGTFAHKHIALAFASWISPEFELYLVAEFDRLKEEESTIKSLQWDLARSLTKINYEIHTNAIKENLIPKKLSEKQKSSIYANEADILNLALFSQTAQEWKNKNKNKEGNIRDYANISQLICLSNLENLNSILIKEGFKQSQRLTKLNSIAISQMKILTKNDEVKKLK